MIIIDGLNCLDFVKALYEIFDAGQLCDFVSVATFIEEMKDLLN